MQLNEIHNEHENASVSLKVLLLIFGIILIGALGYLVFQQYYAPAVSENETAPNVTAEVAEDSTETVADPCDFTGADTTDFQAASAYDIFGGETFDTLVCGYFSQKTTEIEGEQKTLAYINIKEFADQGFKTSIQTGLSEGNTVNSSSGATEYQLGCGCTDGSSVTVDEHLNFTISAADEQKLIKSTNEKPLLLKISFEEHLGSGCNCCALMEGVKVL
jgi:hypothetical protein